MKTRPTPRTLGRMLALLTVVIGVAAPAASPAPRDAVDRYLTAQSSAPDAIDRWLAHDATMPMTRNPISDVASSIRLARAANQREQTPVSDVANSLRLNSEQLDHNLADAPRPISGVADSNAVARQTAAASNGAETAGAAFAWREAGIGAGAALLLVAIVAYSRHVLRRHRELIA